MRLETIIKGTPIALPEMLDAREQRMFRQQELLKKGAEIAKNSSVPLSLISFSMNFAGEIKAFPFGEAAFDEGLKELRATLPEKKLLHYEESRKHTGYEAFFLIAIETVEIKKMTSSIEESHPLGRLFDIDVLDADGHSVSRSVIGLPPRTCLICGQNAKACSRSRNHTLEVIQWRTAQILNDFFRGHAADTAAACAVRALLYEVSATPKPGLVDRNNSGSHKDMDFFTFLDSSAALIPWFRDFFCVGWDSCTESDEQLFARLRFAGQGAESSMFSATNGVNTHKGLIFASAIVLGALGKSYAIQNGLADMEVWTDTEKFRINLPVSLASVLDCCQKLGICSLGDFSSKTDTNEPTAGKRFHAAYGITGARGEAAAGFPSVLSCGLPALKQWLQDGFSLNDAAVLTLLSLLSEVEDTNMIHRGGIELAESSKEEVRALLFRITPDNFNDQISALDSSYIKKNLSPGGCADLLAVSLMFLFLEHAGMMLI